MSGGDNKCRSIDEGIFNIFNGNKKATQLGHYFQRMSRGHVHHGDLFNSQRDFHNIA